MRLEAVLLMLSVIAPSSPSTPPSARLFQSLFAPAAADQPTADVIGRTRHVERFRVLCGMTLVAPDPGLQSRMPTLPPPRDLHHTLRVEEPPVCSGREERSR
jgi:hypothetical protein